MSCPDCTKGSFLPGEPRGHFLPNKAYFASRPTATQTATEGQEPTYADASPASPKEKRAVVLLTDAFGLPLKNCKIMADMFAERLDCDVYVPDIFDGHPLFGVHELTPKDTATTKLPWTYWLKMFWMAMFHIPDFIKSRPSVVDHRLDLFFKDLKEEKKYDKIGAVGYCFGGSTAVRLGAKDHWVNSIVVCHPGQISMEQIRNIKVPASWVCAEDDFTFRPKKRLEAEANFASRKDNKAGVGKAVEYEFVDYKGTSHGFAARPNISIPEIKASFEKSMDQTVAWFKKTL